MDHLPAPRPSHPSALATTAAVVIALAAGPAALVGAFVAHEIHGDLRGRFEIPGSYKVFGLPSGLVAFILGAAVAISVLAVLFVLALRRARPKHQPASGYSVPAYDAPPARGNNLAIGVSFVLISLGVATLLALMLLVALLSAAPDPL
jgi:hypothetical protein